MYLKDYSNRSFLILKLGYNYFFEYRITNMRYVKNVCSRVHMQTNFQNFTDSVAFFAQILHSEIQIRNFEIPCKFADV